MYKDKARLLKQKMEEDQIKIELIDAAGGIKKIVTQSDKVGFNWENFYVNDILIKQVYVEQEVPYGTADNPIEYTPDSHLIQNAFYAFEGVRKVWMGEKNIQASWNNDGWEIF